MEECVRRSSLSPPEMTLSQKVVVDFKMACQRSLQALSFREVLGGLAESFRPLLAGLW
jgi:hypothetical protein